MKFSVLGREVDVWWRHLLVYLGISLLIVLAAQVLWSFYGLINGFTGSDPALYFISLGTNPVLPYLQLIMPFLFAVVLFAVAGRLGLKKDVALCRSIAGAEFILVSVIAALSVFSMMYFSATNSVNSGTLGFGFLTTALISAVLGAAVSAVTQYLWLLAVLEYDKNKAVSAVGLAATLAFAMFLVGETVHFLSATSAGGIYSTTLNAPTFYSVLSYFFFSLPIFYQIKDKTLDTAAYAFAAIFLIQVLLSAMMNLFLRDQSAFFDSLYGFMYEIPELALFYLLSGAKLSKPG